MEIKCNFYQGKGGKIYISAKGTNGYAELNPAQLKTLRVVYQEIEEFSLEDFKRAYAIIYNPYNKVTQSHLDGTIWDEQENRFTSSK